MTPLFTQLRGIDVSVPPAAYLCFASLYFSGDLVYISQGVYTGFRLVKNLTVGAKLLVESVFGKDEHYNSERKRAV
jgi:hypothetical protein